MSCIFLTGRFVDLTGYAANDFEAMAAGTVGTLYGAISVGGVSFGTSAFVDAPQNYAPQDMEALAAGAIGSLPASGVGDTAFSSGRFVNA